MLITLSERLLSERIRELENIPQFTVAEITSQMKYYGARLFQHIAEYGVYLRELCIQNGELGTFRFEIAPIYSDEDRATRFNGIRFMNPLSVTVEYSDLPGFFQNGLALTAAQEAFMFAIIARQKYRTGSGDCGCCPSRSPVPLAGGNGPEKCCNPVK